VDLEVVHVRIAGIPSDDELAGKPSWHRDLSESLQWYACRTEPISKVPPAARSLGFDIAWSGPSFHSAIYQPGLDQSVPNLFRELNEFGLFGSIAQAGPQFEEAVGVLGGGICFCLLEVTGVPWAGEEN
jgi:hypothetical protein